LGFRWFFSFLLFTEFRKERRNENGEYLFLFDEPASNLHQASQQKLLEQFEKLTNKSKIIYSTHSHYLLNPKFLLTSFVVIDKGRKERKNGEINLDSHKQDIKIELYKNFVSNSKNEETHFKPILDCLEYIENPFIKTSNVVFLEGKFDYYAFKWIKEILLNNKKYNFSFYPGASVNKYEDIFREYLANNRKFIAVFDSDNEGKKAKKEYLKKISQELERNIFTLNEIKEKFDNFQTENLFHTEAERLRIQKLSFPNIKKYEKGKFNTAIQELFIKNEKFELLATTKKNFEKVFDFIQKKFKNLK
jgi:energy-coupling factor transporter ATP-binding protein EcfA2